MQNPSSPHQESDAKLEIRVDKQGFVSYNCDWEPGESGLIGIASIFYKLMVDDLCWEILEEIKQQCVLNDNEDEYAAMAGLLNAKIDKDETSSKTTGENSVVVSPDQVFNI